jgi:hypothetical protein
MNRLREWMMLCEAKIIAYHGTGSRIEQFSQAFVSPHYFTQDKAYAEVYSGGKTPISLIDKPKKMRNYLLTVELDIRHMFDTKNDPEARNFYNTQFVPYMNRLRAKYGKPSLAELAAGQYVSFVDADWLYRYFTRTDHETPYDGMLVEEGIGKFPAIVPFHASQIKIIKRQIIDLSKRTFDGNKDVVDDGS